MPGRLPTPPPSYKKTQFFESVNGDSNLDKHLGRKLITYIPDLKIISSTSTLGFKPLSYVVIIQDTFLKLRSKNPRPNANATNTKTKPTYDGVSVTLRSILKRNGITTINKDNIDIPSNYTNLSQPQGSPSTNNSWVGVYGTDMALVVKINVEPVLKAINDPTITTGFYDNTAYWVKKIYLYEYNFKPLF